MFASKNSFLDHVKWFRTACRSVGAEAIVALESWQAFVRQGDRHTAFYPQFQATIDGQLQYQHVLTDAAWMFSGWLPYRLKRWDTAIDKLAFKRYAQSVGLRVPQHWLDTRDAPSNVVVKTPRSSFGQQISGPYRSGDQHPLDLASGEYYEEFVGGRLLKIWYWNEQPVCAEVDQLPFVWGDNTSTISELIVRRASQYRRLGDKEKGDLLKRSEPLVRYYGRSLDQVLAKGAKQVVEFRYGSSLMLAHERSVADLVNDAEVAWLAQAKDAGQKLYAAIPAEMRENTMFTVDAILPQDGQAYFLEVNCNPTVHPLVYPIMANQLLGAKAPADTASAVH